MSQNYRRQTTAWRPDSIYNHVISEYIIRLKSSQLKPIQFQQRLFDRDWATFKLSSVSLFLEAFKLKIIRLKNLQLRS